ncbi:hypothetical protein IFR05_006079 [Cadophora sp. M221]|nr:hypothetical protein IFR05_006079 [Cadophora sp. M221]
MPLFNPDTEMDLGGDLDFDLYTPQEGYASARALELGTSVDGHQIPLNSVSQLDYTSPQTTPPQQPRHSPAPSAPWNRISPPGPQSTATPILAPSRQVSLRSVYGFAVVEQDGMDYAPAPGFLGNQQQVFEDDGYDWSSHAEFPGNYRDGNNNRPEMDRFGSVRQVTQNYENHFQSLVEGGGIHQAGTAPGYLGYSDFGQVESNRSMPKTAKKPTRNQSTKRTPTVEEDLEEDGVEADHTVVQQVHKDRYESDFGKLRLRISEAALSFIRDGWVVLKDKGVPCFKPNGGAWKKSPRNRHKYGEGQVWMNSDEATFRDALFWALGRDMPNRSPHSDPKFRDSYAEARAEKSHELERYLDAGRVEGMMDAAAMHSNRQSRLRNLQQLIPDNPAGRPQRSLAQAIVNAIAGKHVDLDALAAHIKDPAAFEYAPLPAWMQVDPVYLQPGPAADRFIQEYLADWRDEKRAADYWRKEAGWAFAYGAGAR